MRFKYNLIFSTELLKNIYQKTNKSKFNFVLKNLTFKKEKIKISIFYLLQSS